MAPSLLLTSIGAWNGARRNPAWYHNPRAHPDVQVQLGRDKRRVHATALLPGDANYERLWKLADTNNSGHYSAYQRATSRPIPVVVLAPRDQGSIRRWAPAIPRPAGPPRVAA